MCISFIVINVTKLIEIPENRNAPLMINGRLKYVSKLIFVLKTNRFAIAIVTGSMSFSAKVEAVDR